MKSIPHLTFLVILVMNNLAYTQDADGFVRNPPYEVRKLPRFKEIKEKLFGWPIIETEIGEVTFPSGKAALFSNGQRVFGPLDRILEVEAKVKWKVILRAAFTEPGSFYENVEVYEVVFRKLTPANHVSNWKSIPEFGDFLETNLVTDSHIYEKNEFLPKRLQGADSDFYPWEKFLYSEEICNIDCGKFLFTSVGIYAHLLIFFNPLYPLDFYIDKSVDGELFAFKLHLNEEAKAEIWEAYEIHREQPNYHEKPDYEVFRDYVRLEKQ